MSRYLKAINHRNDGPPPVWLMRQAGRFLPEFRSIRKKHSFIHCCRTPEIAAEITLMPIKRFHFDAAILFSDILTILNVFDVKWEIVKGKGPVIYSQGIDHLVKREVRETLCFVEKAIKLLKNELEVPLIGFCGSPFTVASYLIEGGASQKWNKVNLLMKKDPKMFHDLLEKITEATVEYLQMQIDAGVDTVQIFESWGHLLDPSSFKGFSLPYIKKISEKLNQKKKFPVKVFCKGSLNHILPLVDLPISAISVDWTYDLQTLRQKLNKKIVLQGNLDPNILLGTKNDVIEKTKKIVFSMRGDPGYIFNLGHGILPNTPIENVESMIEVIRHG